jgi:hypothetical protein
MCLRKHAFLKARPARVTDYSESIAGFDLPLACACARRDVCERLPSNCCPRISRQAGEFNLSSLEFKLLRTLIERRGRMQEPDRLLNDV